MIKWLFKRINIVPRIDDQHFFHCCLLDRECRNDRKEFGSPYDIYIGKYVVRLVREDTSMWEKGEKVTVWRSQDFEEHPIEWFNFLLDQWHEDDSISLSLHGYMRLTKEEWETTFGEFPEPADTIAKLSYDRWKEADFKPPPGDT